MPDGWTLAPGLRAVVIADASDGLSEPVGLAFAGNAFSGLLYVSDQKARTLWAIDTATGTTTAFVAPDAFPTTPSILTAVVWDSAGTFDGNLYISNSVSDGDQDNVIYRVDATGKASLFAKAPGPGLDSVYAMAFAPTGAAVPGLFVSGDTDGSSPDWGVYDGSGQGVMFSDVAGVQGIVFDPQKRYGTGPIAARPMGGGFSGDGSITPLDFQGVAQTPIAQSLGGVHANVIAPPGLFNSDMVAASWSTGKLFRVSPDGTITELASGLELSNYDANILAVSPDGRVLMIADRLASRIVCIEQE